MCSCLGASSRLTINRTYRTEDVAGEIAPCVRAKECAAVRMQPDELIAQPGSAPVHLARTATQKPIAQYAHRRAKPHLASQFCLDNPGHIEERGHLLDFSDIECD